MCHSFSQQIFFGTLSGATRPQAGPENTQIHPDPVYSQVLPVTWFNLDSSCQRNIATVGRGGNGG